MRPFSGLLQVGLLAFLAAIVAGHSRPRRLRSPRQLGLERVSARGRRRGGPPGLAADAAAVDADPDVDGALVAGGDERLAGQRHVLAALEVLVDAAIVDVERAVSGADDHAGDGALALAGRLDLGVGGDGDGARGDRRRRRSSAAAAASRARRSSSSASRAARSSAVSSRSSPIAIGSRSAPGTTSFFSGLAAGFSAASSAARLRLRRRAASARPPRRRAPRLLGSGLLGPPRPRARRLLGGLLGGGCSALGLGQSPRSRPARARRRVAHLFTSKVFGCCAACGWSGPA